MPYTEQLNRLSGYLGLSAYQSYILGRNATRYDLSRLVKRGGILYAPYLPNQNNGLREDVERAIFGPRADLIGPDRMLIHNRRGIKIYSSGIYRGKENGKIYYADGFGNRVKTYRV